MKVKIKLLACMVFFMFFLYLCLPSLSVQMQIENHFNEDIMVQVSSSSGDFEIELEKYLVGVLSSEMPANFELEALKAQAVASRSYVYSRLLKVDDTVSSQVYQKEDVLKEKWKENYEMNLKKIQSAIFQTKGQVMMYDNEIIHAYFFSSSAGKTNNSEDYWTTAYPYLVSVDSSYDAIKKDNVRQKSLSSEEVKKLFKEEVTSFEVVSYYENGYVKEVKVNSKSYSGKEIRELCGLSSSFFTVKLQQGALEFQSVGSGHGVGMSQYGAQGMALAGYNYQEILLHYYRGVKIVNK